MENKGRIICRLCLSYCKNSFEPIEELIQEILNSIWINLDLSISNEPVMCNNCSNKLKTCFRFKTEYLCAQFRALTFIKHKDSLKANKPAIYSDKVQNNAVHFFIEQGLCCFCMNSVKCISIKELDIQNVKIVELLQMYFPEPGVDITKQPTICNPCYDSLQCHCSFISDCLSVEKTITDYCAIEGANFKGQIDLNNVLGYKSKSVAETCKKEEMLCEPAKSLDLNVEIKQENFMNTEEYKLEIKTEGVFIKTEQNLYDSIEECDLVKSEPNAWEDEEIPAVAVDSQSEICATEVTYGNNSNHENVSEMVENIFKCDICSYQTNHETDFQGHALIHKNTSEIPIYKCELCDYKSTSKDYVRRHMVVHKSISEVEAYKCRMCTFQTKYRPSILRHELTHKTASKMQTRQRYNCELCPYMANQKQHLKKHMHHHKNALAYKSALYSLETSKYNFQNHIVADEGSSEVTTHKCEICGYETLMRGCLTRHMFSHIGGAKVTATSTTPETVNETDSAIEKSDSQLVVDKPTQRMIRLSSWICEYEEELSVVNDNEIMCNVCSKVIQVTRKHHVMQHLEGRFHLMKLNPQPKDTFNEELCETLLAANIPLYKVDNPGLKRFLEKYMCRTIPSVTTLRKTCVANIYNKIMKTIRKNIANNYLWISADETTDPLGRCVVNVVVGTLRPDGPSDSYLVATKIIETATAENVATVINSALDDLCINNGKGRSKVLLFLTDAAAHMLETGKLLKAVYPSLLHITCTAHALHRVCDFIRSEFRTVDTLISTFKKIFVSAKLRTLYKNVCPLPLPPAPVTTRSGTWIEAALFYSKNLETLKEAINYLDNDTHTFTVCKNIFQRPVLNDNLKYINNNFSCLPEQIKYFESRSIPLKERISKFESIITHLKSIPEEFGHGLKQKVEATYARSPDISVLHFVCSENFENQQTQLKYEHLIPYFKYAPLTCFKYAPLTDLLSPKRSNFTKTNLEHHLIINANSKVMWNVDVEEL